ncbi:GNAT family N-acetyltransferase [candidate division GN15 bacterium]|nr:GNAT family N-acetyltransferase [candidate division GN15 bacterium]
MTYPTDKDNGDYSLELADLQTDRQEVLDFWVDQFPRWKTTKYKYFYLDNPDGPAMLWLVRETTDKRIVGTLALLRRELLIDRQPHPAAVSADIVVHREHRRRGLSIVLFGALRDYLNTSDLVVIFGTPNPKSKGGAEQAGYKTCGLEKRYVRLLRSRPVIQSRLKVPLLASLLAIPVDLWIRRGLPSRSVGEIETTVGEALDERIDKVMASAAEQFRIVGNRSSAWVNWRASECPYRHLHIFTAERSDDRSLIGYIMFEIKDNVAYIFDCLAGDIDDLHRLLREFVVYADQQQCRSIEMIHVGNSQTEAVLDRLGFAFRSEGRPFVLLLPGDSAYREIMLNPENWFFTVADNDA